MIDLVRKRHDGDGWIIFSELAERVGGGHRRADYAALGLWASTKYELHLYEEKISREDLKRELRDPTKANGVGRYAHYWWLLLADEKVMSDLVIPDAWGIIVPKKHGDTRRPVVLRKAPKLKPQPFGPLFAIEMIRNISKKWVDPKKHDDLVQELYRVKHGTPDLCERMMATMEGERPCVRNKGHQGGCDPDHDDAAKDYDAAREKTALEKKLASMQSSMAKFKEASGIDLADRWDWRAGQIGEAVKLALELQGRIGDPAILDHVRSLSESAAKHEEAAKAAAQAAVDLRRLVSVIEHAPRCRTKHWGMSQECSCGAEPMSQGEKTLAADVHSGDEGAQATADRDDHDGGDLDRGHPGAPKQDAGLLLRDQRDALPHG